MSLTRALALNTGVQIAGKIVSTALGVVIVGLMTRLLGQAGFGAYSTANAYLQVFALLLDLGVNLTLVALLGEHAGDDAFERRCVSALFTLRIILAVGVLLVLAPAVSIFLPYPASLKLAILALTGSFIFPSVNLIVVGVQQRHFRMWSAAVGENISRVVVLVGLLLARPLGWGLVNLMWLISFGALLSFVFNLIATRRFGDFRWNWDPEFWRFTLKRSWPIGVSILFNLVYYKADTLILSLTRSQAEVGIYGAAYRVLDILITVPFMYAGVLLPVLSASWAKQDRNAFASLMQRSTDLMMLFVMPMIAGALILGPAIMRMVAGFAFVDSGRVLRVLILAVAVIYINVIFAHGVIAVGRQRQMLPIYIAVAALTLSGYLLFIPRYGLWAAAWLTVFSETCVMLGSYAVTHYAAPFHIGRRVPIVAILASMIMAVVVWLLQKLWLPIPLLVGGVIYSALIYIFGAVSKDTLKEILSFKKEFPR